MLKLLSEAFQNLTKVFKKTNNPAVKDELIKIGDELEALSEQVQKGSGKIEEQTVQLNKILDDINERDADLPFGKSGEAEEYIKNRGELPFGKSGEAQEYIDSLANISDDLQKSLDLTDSYGFQVTKDLDDVVPFNELSPKDIEMIKLGVPMNSKKYRIETEAISKGEMAPSQMSGIPESQAKALKSLEDEMLGGLDMKTFTKVSNAEIAEKERIIAVANDLIEEGRLTEARELLESIGEDLSADRVLNANGGYMNRPKAFLGGLFGGDEEDEDPEYKAWKDIYRKNPDVADMHPSASDYKRKLLEEIRSNQSYQDGGDVNYYIGGKPVDEEEYDMQGDYMDLTPEGMELFKTFRLENPDVDERIILDALKKQGYSGDMQGFAKGGGVGSLFRMK